ncbi:MAG: 4-hydroxy-tetrahydrodipicolinate reductase [Muribaculaceae bacterium]|nr:4-hydroxy-tetrahydrodipicolinate reductase [Muribaculaceae bacterium]
MKIAIIGYGKMGHAIERIARDRGHEIVAVIDAGNVADMDGDAFASAEAAIEFTTPSTAPANILKAASRGVPVVCGSTGWNDRRAEVESGVIAAGGSLLASSNFSIGVNVFNVISRRLASIMSHLPQYKPSMTEVHHIHKLDHPSGTAITLAEGIMAEDKGITSWTDAGIVHADSPDMPSEARAASEAMDNTPASSLPILSLRQGEVPGIHTINWDSQVDTITISHSAKSRDGFALGAVMAAEWLAGRKGIFTIDQMMEDLIK